MQHRRVFQGIVGLVAASVVVAGFVPFDRDGLSLDAPFAWTGEAEAAACPAGMVSVVSASGGGKFCIDKYEASTEEIDKKGKTIKKHSPYVPVTGIEVKAVSVKGRVPQGYISRDEAEAACENAGKRLCSNDEWVSACKGKNPTKYPYGDDHEDGYCNDAGVSSFNLLYGPGGNKPPEASAYTRENMNDPRLNQQAGTVAASGKFSKCKNGFGAFDMVGNLHEWTSDPGGTFRGGYYLDTHINGDGCDYRTTAHDHQYHDYSTGFRCCWSSGDKKPAKKADGGTKPAKLEKKADKKADEKNADKKAEKKKADKKADKTEKVTKALKKKKKS